MKRVSVSVQNDYLERMSKTRPINAVAELVWNSLDADADKIKVKLFDLAGHIHGCFLGRADSSARSAFPCGLKFVKVSCCNRLRCCSGGTGR